MNSFSNETNHHPRNFAPALYPTAASVSNEIDSIIASNTDCEPVFSRDILEKMVKLNINPFKNPPKEFLELPDNLPTINSGVKHNPSLKSDVETEKQDTEKNAEVDENMYLVAGNDGWSTVGDVHDLLLGIIESN